MAFNDRLKEKRIEAGLKQVELAEIIGISDRTIQNYEAGTSKPKNFDLVYKIAQALDTTIDYLLDNNDNLALKAHKKGGAKCARDIRELTSEVSGLFSGGSLSEDEIDAAMKAINEAYWISKEKNKKYTPKKYLR